MNKLHLLLNFKKTYIIMYKKYIIKNTWIIFIITMNDEILFIYYF
jgi:hypothetical protein